MRRDSQRSDKVTMISSYFSVLRFYLGHPMNRGNQMSALLRILKWQIGSRLVPGDVAVPFGDGAKLLVARGMTGATGNVYAGLHEFEDMAFVLHCLTPYDLFLDVGANIGSYTVLAATSCRADVIAIEPVPTTYQRLVDNIRLNHIDDRVKALQIGVGGGESSLWFSTGLDTMNHVALSSEKAHTIEVSVKTLDSIIGARVPAIIKIDVEGFETEVVRGGKRILEASELLAVILELNGRGTRYGFKDLELHREMTRYGFSPHLYDPLTREISLRREPANKGNTLYLRNIPAVKDRLARAPRRKIHGHII